MKEKVTYWPLHFLRWFYPPYLLEEIEGDLIQKFEKELKKFSERKAKRRLMWIAILIALKGRNTPKQGEALS